MPRVLLVLKMVFLLILVSMTVSCQRENIDGIWIGQYNILDNNGSKSYHSINTIIKFEDNKFINHVLNKNSKKQVFEFQRNGNSIIPLSKSHAGFIVESVSKDSLVMSMPQMKEFRLVYKRHTNSFKTKSKVMVSDFADKSYRNHNSNQTYDFKSDHSVLLNSKMKGNWQLDFIESINVLKLTIGDSTNFMVVDSVVNDKLFLTKYSKTIDRLVLTVY